MQKPSSIPIIISQEWKTALLGLLKKTNAKLTVPG